MKKLILSILLLLFLSFPAWGAIYYVDFTGGLDTNSGLTEALAWKTINKVNTSSFSAGDSILFKRGETWSEQLTVPSSGSSDNPITFGSYGGVGDATITGGTYSFHTNSRSYLTIQNLCMNGKQFYISGSTGVTVNYCLIKNSNLEGILGNNCPSTKINNCTIIANQAAGIRNMGTGDMIVKNCLISGNGYLGGSYGLRATSPATITYSNCLITGNNYNPSNNIQSTDQIIDAGNNIKEVVSKPNKYVNNTVYFVDSLDDNSYGYWTDVAAAIAPYGGKITAYAIGYLFSGDSTAEAALVALKNAGHEIGNHSWSHSDMTATTAFTITTTNTGTNTYAINRTSKTITLASSGNPENNVVIDWSSTPKEIDHLINAVIGKGWTITNTTNVGIHVDLDSLSDTGGPIALTTPAALDVTSGNGYPYWSNEIGKGQTYLTGILGAAPTSMGNLFDLTNAGLQSYQQSVTGLIGARSGALANTLAVLSSINVYNVLSISFSTYLKGDGSEAQIRANTRHFYELCKQIGAIFVFVSHTTADITVAQHTYIVSEIASLGGTFETFSSAIAKVKADHSTADNITYTKTYSDISDFHLQPGSPCINAGTDVGLIQDYEGKPVPRGNAPDIGAYEYMGSGRSWIYKKGMIDGGMINSGMIQ